MQLTQVLLAASILGTPVATSAQSVAGLYVGLGAGLNITQQTSITKESVSPAGLPMTLSAAGPSSMPGSAGGDLSGSTGFTGVLSLGWGFGNGLRAELEGNYRVNNGDTFSGGNFFGEGAAAIGGGSNEQKFGGMFNVMYDLNGVSPWLVPYLGVGVGYQAINERWHEYNNLQVTSAFAPPMGIQTLAPGHFTVAGNSTEGSFAYQVIVGAAIPRPKVLPGLALTAEYRFLGTAGNRSYGGTVQALSTRGAFETAPADLTLGPSYNHSILVGLRYSFGMAPPPPPPPEQPPVPQPARSYLVFFDWDKATLTDRARQIIREAADNSTKVQYTRIEVNGYTDTSGTPQYNMGLSIRRANAVRAELTIDGVPANAITIQGFGETHLLVPTGPGVREPQNRRVEIIIR